MCLRGQGREACSSIALTDTISFKSCFPRAAVGGTSTTFRVLMWATDSGRTPGVYLPPSFSASLPASTFPLMAANTAISHIAFPLRRLLWTPLSPSVTFHRCLSGSPFASSSAALGFKASIAVGSAKSRSSFVKIAAVRHLSGSLTESKGFRFAIVIARFNEIVTKRLLEGALETFKRYSVKEEDVDVVWVPGSFEIGVVAEKLGKSQKYQAVLCIGAVIRGDTSHYDAVANSAASGVLSAGLNSGVPCIFGVLTCDNMEQAIDRAGGKAGNKGSEAAVTAIEMASLFEHHLKQS